MDEEDNVRLTSFRPLSPDNSKSNFSLAKFFLRKRPQARVEIKVDVPKSYRPPTAAANQRTVSHEQQGSRSFEIHKSFSSPLLTRKTSGPQVEGVGGRYATPGYRNVSAVLGRLSVAADKRGQLRQEYKESNFKQYWMPDENCKECYECGEKFNTFRRRHHCRLCGQIFCYRCCYMEIPGKLMGYTGFLRVCTYCHKVVKAYTQSPDLSVARNMEQTSADYRMTSPDLETSSPSISSNFTVQKTYPFDFDEEENIYPQSSLRKVSGGSAVIASGPYEYDQMDWTSPLQGRRPFDAFGVCAAEADMLKQDSFRELWHQIISPRSGLELQSHRFRLKTYQNCLVGSELVDWLLTYEKASTRNQAVTIGQKLLDYSWLEPVPNTRDGGAVFKDEYVLYQPGMVATRETSANKRSSTFWSDVDKVGDKNTVESDEGNAEKNDDDDNDEMVPHWFKQLEQQGVEPATEEKDSSYSQENAGKVKATGPKLLDLDLMNGVASEEGDSELSLKVDLQHFGEPGRIGSMSADSNQESHGSKLSLITDAPPPPLEQYVYTEGYPYTPLRPSTKKSNEGGVVLSTSNTADEIFSGAMIAKKIGVDRPSTPELSELREDNGERLAMERLRAAHKYYLNTLLDQLLKDAGLSVDWKDIILPLVKQVSEQVTPDVRKDDDMDICQYVKFKKIPGGNKSDCQMISGVVFTKNIANKKMANALINPKILVLSCAIDYQRNENRLASLDPLVLQEYEFLKNFVARVVSLRPNVLVVEKTVSRLAQDMLLQHGITVVLNVKPEVIERIARCTRADVLRSMEQVSRPQLGSCHSFNVQRYLLKNGESKTLIFIDGCPTDLGCTVILRGGNSFVLAEVKRIFQHMVYVAYSLRLELHFLMDEFAMPPDPKVLFEERGEWGDYQQKAMNSTEISMEGSPDSHETTAVNFTEIFSSAMKRTVLSSSPFLEYPLPYLLTEAGINCAIRSTLPRKIYWSACIDAECKAHPLTEQDLEEFDFANPRQRINKAVCVLEPHPFIAASLTMDHSDRLFQGLLSDFRAQGGQIHLTRNGATITRSRSKWFDGVGKKISPKPEKTDDKAAQGHRKTDQIAAEILNGEMSRQNLTAPSCSTHFNRKVDCLDPFNHQRIAVLFSSYSSESNNSPRPCISPWAVFMEFYRRNDITLGGFLEIYCFRPSYICPNPNCDVPMVDHVRYFAHGTGSVYIHMRNLESPIPGFQHTILTWSWCKECKQVTPIVPLSPEAWALSFAKYLELRFYARSYQRRASVEPCGHSLHRDHYQYFAYANMVASFKYRSIKLFETVIPPPLINIKEKTRDASFWLSDLKAMATRSDTVFSDFKDRLDSLKANSSQPDREAKIQQFVIELSEEHDLFCEQVRIVEKKAESLRTTENPLAMEDEHSCHHLSPDDRQALEYVIADSLNSLKKILCKAVDSLNTSLQEFVQAEKKKNVKSLKEGKSPSLGPTDAVKSGDTQGLKSSDLLGLPGDDPVSLNVSPSPSHSPSQTPWGSRTTSPYRSLMTNEETPEALTPGDMEVFRANCMFRPISSTDKIPNTPAESPTDGIIPVGGVVKGHPIPQAEEPSKSVPLPRVALERAPTEASGTPACSFKGFVVVAPTGEGSQGGMVNSERQHCLVVEGDKSNPALEASVSDGNKARKDLSGDATVEGRASLECTKEISVGSMKEGTGVNMEGMNEPPGVNIEKRGELSGGNTEETKVSTEGPMEQGLPEGNMQALKQYVLNGEDTTVPSEKSIDRINGLGEHSTGNNEGHRVLFRDSEKRENCLLVDNAGETRRLTGESLPFTTENIANTNEELTPKFEELLAAKKGKNKWKKGKVHITEEMAEKDPKMFTVGQEKGGVTDKMAHRKIPFTRGHRRVASSPPNISILLTDGKSWKEGEVDVTVSALVRCRSDSDLSVYFRQNLDVSMTSLDAILDQLNVEEDLSAEEDETSKPGIEETSDNSHVLDGGRVPLGFRKVSTIPKTLQKRGVFRTQSLEAKPWSLMKKKGVVRSSSWAAKQWQATAKKALANESGESDASVISDGTTGISRREKVKHIISSFMPGSAFQPVASTFPNHEHHLLPPGEKVLVVVSEKETSSIIAYTLSTKEYNERLHEIQRTLWDIKNGTALEHHLLNKSEVSISVDMSVKGQSTIPELPLAAETIVRINSEDSQDDYVHLDLADSSEAVDRIESEAAEIEITSGGNLEFLQKSGEVQKELETLGTQLPNHGRGDKSKYPKVKYSKIKQTGAKDEAGANQDSQVQDDPSLVEFGFQRKNVIPPVDFHVKHQFADSTARFYCSIYYAEQFRNLRKRIFLDGEEKYIRSLQHSVAWGARGGKSGSAFFKSLDDRFVMKQMSRLELQSFLEFAPHYFRYINKALDDQRPTLLAKILGIYRIGFKNSQTSATMRQDVLVMENLFYDRKVDKTFDLKGSMRGRYVQSSELNEVLMDENLLEMIREHPIYFRPHSKTVLSRAIHNDTEFLAQQMVMDYSLLVGIDEAQLELVIGIIDFIRTFTWDKKLEMYVKSSGILGGQGRMPTVVSPELYRTRFTEAMHRYFLMVPDKWTGLGNDLD